MLRELRLIRSGRSIGLYSAGLSVAHVAGRVDYLDRDPERRAIAESFGATSGHVKSLDPSTRRRHGRRYDIVIEATSRASGLRRAILPELLAFVAQTGFPAERVTTLTAGWEEAPAAYAARTTKLVLCRDH